MKRRLKPLLPSLREKKRYVAYEILSSHQFDGRQANQAIKDAAQTFLGTLGMAKAGIITLDDEFNPAKQRGMARVNHKKTDEFKASLVMIKQIDGKDVIVRSVGASGMLRKTKENYLS